MSAVSSSPVPSGLGQLARAPSPRPLPDAVCLAHFLAGLPDPRDRRGRRFPLTAIVTAAAASVLARTGSLTAIAQWTADAPRRVLLTLGFAFDSGRREEREPRTHPHSPPRRSARSPPEDATAGQAEILGSAASSPTGSPPEDLTALDRLLGTGGPHSVLRRDDLTVRTERTVWAVRRT